MLLSHQNLSQKYNLSINILDYYGLMSAIPTEWKNVIKDNKKLESIHLNTIDLVTKNIKVTKIFTQISVKKLKSERVTGHLKWNSTIDVTLNDEF